MSCASASSGPVLHGVSHSRSFSVIRTKDWRAFSFLPFRSLALHSTRCARCVRRAIGVRQEYTECKMSSRYICRVHNYCYYSFVDGRVCATLCVVPSVSRCCQSEH